MKDQLREKPVIVVVKKGKHHPHHGGAWKVAFADFMTAMMAMFLVLWIVGQSSDVKTAIAGYFQDPLGRADQFGSSIMPGAGAARPLRANPLKPQDIFNPRIDRLRAFAGHLQERLEELPEFEELSEHIEVELLEQGMRVHLVEDSVGVFFESGSATPQTDGRRILRTLGAEFQLLPNPVVIEGHTDATPYGPGARYTNWELSADRANAARRVLIEGGLRSDQLQEVRGLADRQLRFPDRPRDPRNRRVTITLLMGFDPMEAVSGAAPTDTATNGSTSSPGSP